MRFDKLTAKFQQALAEAQSLALAADSSYLEAGFVLKALFGTKILMRFHTVARNTDHRITQSLKFRQQAVEIQTLGGTTGRAVFRIEINHQRQMAGRIEIAAGR